MRKFFKGLIVSTSALVVGFATVFGGKGLAFKPEELDLSIPEPEEYIPVQKEQTHQSKLLKSVMTTIESFTLDGEAVITTSDDFRVVIDLDVAAQIDIENPKNIKVNGDIKLRLNGAEFNTNILYLDNIIFFSYKENRFKFETDDLITFVTDDLLSGLGVNASLPDELANIVVLDMPLLNTENKDDLTANLINDVVLELLSSTLP